MRIVSGVQPSSRLHIGNYLGAIRQYVELQDEGEALYFLANYHALTTVRSASQLREYTLDAAVSFLALGCDPKKAALFRQSDVPEVTELYWLLGTVVPHSNLERAHSYKDKIAKGISPDFGLFAYPVLMAADILLYGADVVPVGKDQIQHVEFARDWATKFNVTYVPGYDPADPTGKDGHSPGVLKLPEARVQKETASVPGIDGEKMSKSYGNTLDIFGDEKEIKKRIMSIKTDSTGVDAPKPTENNPLYELLKLLAPVGAFEDVDRTWRAGGKGYGDYKKLLVEYFHHTFGAARTRREELLRDPGEVERILLDGAERARRYSTPIIEAVRKSMGIR